MGTSRIRSRSRRRIRSKSCPRKIFRCAKAPGGARLLMQVFGESLSQAISQCFADDRAVIVVRGSKLRGEFVSAMNRHGKTADVIALSGALRRNVIGQA